MEKESEKKIAEIEGDTVIILNIQSCKFLIYVKLKILVQMHANKEKALADAAYYKALKEIESNKVTTLNDIFFYVDDCQLSASLRF